MALYESTPPGTVANGKLRWESRAKLPSAVAMSNVLQSGSHIYVSGGTILDENVARRVFEYCVHEDQWRELPASPCYYFTLALVNNCVTTIGGVSVISGGGATNALYNFNGERSKWCRNYPDMPTSRSSCSSASSELYVVVLGGLSEDEDALDTVEVLDTDRLAWYSVARLPRPVAFAACALSADAVYVVGGECVWGGKIKALLDSRDPGPVWTEVTGVPGMYCGCTHYRGRLLVAGGMDSSFNALSTVRAFDIQNHRWATIGEMSTPNTCCSLSVIDHASHVSLLVLGGRRSMAYIRDVVEAVNLDSCL